MSEGLSLGHVRNGPIGATLFDRFEAWPTTFPHAPRSPSAIASSRSTGSTRCRSAGTSRGCPYTLRILLENVLRNGDADDVEAVAGWVAADEPSREISFAPARVLLQDFTGVPAVVDLAAMRNAMADLGGDPEQINPLIPVELVIDHSVQVDEFGTSGAFARNVELEFERNRERYAFLRWGQKALPRLQGRAARDRASCTRSTSSSSRASSRSATARRSPTRSSAPTRTRRW